MVAGGKCTRGLVRQALAWRRAVVLVAALPLTLAGLAALAELPSIRGVTLGLLADPRGGAVLVASGVGASTALIFRGGPALLLRTVVFILAAYVVCDVAVTRRRGVLLALLGAAAFTIARRAADSLSGWKSVALSSGAMAIIGAGVLGIQHSARHAPMRTELPPLPRSPAAPTGARSIVLLSLDTTRADAFEDPDLMPRLNAFAAGAVRFESAFASAPHTHPSMASLLTGLEPLDHGSVSGSPILRRDVTTLAEHCRSNGFATAGFLDNPWLVPAFGLSRGYEYLSGHTRLSEIDDWLGARDRAKPFLLHVHLFTPHGPYELREHELAALGGSRFADVRERIGTTIQAGVIRRSEVPHRHGFDEREIGWMRDVHLSEVRAMDRWIGDFFAVLEARDLLADAVIAVAGDHGEEFGERGGLHHSHTLFPELVRIPMLLRAPGLEPRVDDRVTSITSLGARVLERAGLPAVHHANPVSPIDPERAIVLSVRVRQAGRHLLRATDGEWALHVRVTPGRTSESVALFRHTRDRGEARDIAHEYPDVVERLLGDPQVADALERLRRLPLVPLERTPVPERARARLEVLGY